MWTWSVDKTPLMIVTPISSQTCCAISRTLPDRACEHLVTVLGDPDEVITVMINRLFSFVILHDLSVLKLSA
jgi:hypothetical protein